MNRQKRICLIAGLCAGALADGLLRLSTGDEGNLLVHSVVFLGSFTIVYGLLSIVYKLKKK